MMMGKMKLLRDGVVLQTVDLSKVDKTSILIGRDENCDVRIDDRAVGREHVVVRMSQDAYVLNKLSKFGKLSLNGSEVNGGNVKAGDVVSFADYRLEFEKDESPQPSRTENPALIERNSEVTPHSIAPVEMAAPVLGGIDVPVVESALPPVENAENQQPQDGGLNLNISGDFMNSQPATSESMPQYVDTPQQDMAMDFQGMSDGGDKTAMIQKGALEAKLTVLSGEASVQELALTKSEITIGRATECDISITDKSASRKHLIIRRVGANFVLQDLGSGNGTYVNGQRVTQHDLSGEDVIRIGDTEIRFEAVNSEFQNQQHDFMQVDDSLPEEQMANPDMGMPFAEMPMQEPVMPQDPQMGIPTGGAGTFGGVPGLGGPGSSSKKETLVEKFKRQPLMRKVLIVAVIGGALIMMMDDGQEAKTKAATAKKKDGVAEKKNDPFNALPQEKKQFVINTYQLAFDQYKNREYEKALFEIKKVLDIIPEGYKDSKEIKLYAEKAIEIEKNKDDEKRRKEDKERIEKEVAEYLKQLEAAVHGGKDAEAKDLFNKVFERDPENATALRLKQELDERLNLKKREAEELSDKELKTKKLQALIDEGKKMLSEQRYFEVMERMLDAPTIGCTDEKLLAKAKGLIVEAKKRLAAKLEPHLSAGRKALAAKDFPKARDSFYNALSIDEDNQEAKDGIAKVREELSDRARKFYTEGVIAESVSEWEVAKVKYRQCLDQSMPDDVYFGRCFRKCKRLGVDVNSPIDRATASEPTASNPAVSSGGSVDNASEDPQMPMIPDPGSAK